MALSGLGDRCRSAFVVADERVLLLHTVPLHLPANATQQQAESLLAERIQTFPGERL